MGSETAALQSKPEIRALFGLTQGLPKPQLEILTVEAIRTHRILVDKADHLFQALPETDKIPEMIGSAQHLDYIRACMEMHAQMYTTNTLINILGYIPKVPAN
ncbi:transcriptional repressor TraM [Phyllobacterium zundukense]|uniref:Transcriptional regulator n=1 Tax=Phyllobacterium zundukense TaxID=1867719 RepID=A0A2N9VUL1_9HYPH|nr:transcriptional repressor TraM [Phyllobacterium zundukense]ATU95361.1 transcriptional regulator [Phyllobacterium zundukense]PIO43179.1 transcriptional regulator [Phyllobacterium zundukense]